MSSIKRLTRYIGASGIAIVCCLLLAGSFSGTLKPLIAGGVPRDRQQSQERYLEIAEITGTVTLETGSLKQQGRPAKVGDRLKAPDEGISTGSNSSAKLAVDSGIGTIDVSENTNLQVKRLSTLRNGAKTTDLAMNRGRNRVRVRSFKNPQSRFSIQTPTGIAGVRGTDFTVVVLPTSETRVYTAAGDVEVAAQNQTQRVTGGYYSFIAPGKPPTQPNLVARSLRVSLQLLPAPDEGKVRVSGTVNPTDAVFINGQALDLNSAGEFETIATIAPTRRLTLLVRTPLGEEQVYELVIP